MNSFLLLQYDNIGNLRFAFRGQGEITQNDLKTAKMMLLYVRQNPYSFGTSYIVTPYTANITWNKPAGTITFSGFNAGSLSMNCVSELLIF